MNTPHVAAHCFKYGCNFAPKHIVTMAMGATIKCCDKHLEGAKTVAMTGRPG